MYDLVTVEWQTHLTELRERADRLPELERAGLEGADRVHGGDRHGRRRLPVAERDRRSARGRARHRARTAGGCSTRTSTTASRIPTIRFRLVFVCAMWMTGFDVPSCSTIYLDRPMRGHTLMQTIARANRVFPEKENGLIVDYVGVFRRLEAALAIYAAGSADRRPRKSSARSRRSSRSSMMRSASCWSSPERWDVDLDALARADGFEFIALRDASMEALLIDDVTRRGYLERAGPGAPAVRRDPSRPGRRARTPAWSAVARNLAEKIRSLDAPPDLSRVAGAVTDLLDRSVGAEEYVIRAAADGSGADPIIDLGAIDFDSLADGVCGTDAIGNASPDGRPHRADRRGGSAQPDPLEPGRSAARADRRPTTPGASTSTRCSAGCSGSRRVSSRRTSSAPPRGAVRARARRLRPTHQTRPSARRRGARGRSKRSPVS